MPPIPEFLGGPNGWLGFAAALVLVVTFFWRPVRVIRDRLIYGDTGLRKVTLGVSGMGFLRRIGQEVTLYLRDVITPTGSETIYTLPAGFTPDYSPQYGLIGRTGGRALVAFTINGATVTQNGTQTTAMYAQLKFTTNDPWPTSLPGSAVGVIPDQ